jgi:DNA-binding response OmpR family regulator
MDGRAAVRDVGEEKRRGKRVTASSPSLVEWAGLDAGTIRVALVVAPAFRDGLCESLRAAGMNVQATETPAALESAMADAPADIVVVDADAFNADAYALTTRLRMMSQVGIVMLIAGERRVDRMLALSLGADHCLANPPDPHEIELHVRNLHRRISPPVVVTSGAPRAAGTLSSWRFDVTAWTLTAPNGRSVVVSMLECRLLDRLLQKPGAVVSRGQMLTELERRGLSFVSRNLDMIVSRLRKKVAKACGEPLPVRSARGVGYVFAGLCQTVNTHERAPRQRRPS